DGRGLCAPPRASDKAVADLSRPRERREAVEIALELGQELGRGRGALRGAAEDDERHEPLARQVARREDRVELPSQAAEVGPAAVADIEEGEVERDQGGL